MASTSLTMFTGASRSVSRVPGPPPRTSTPPTVPRGGTTTVVPVSQPRPRRWWCPTAMPATSVMSLRGPILTTAPAQEAVGGLDVHLGVGDEVGDLDELVGLVGDPLAARPVDDRRHRRCAT